MRSRLLSALEALAGLSELEKNKCCRRNGEGKQDVSRRHALFVFHALQTPFLCDAGMSK